MAWALDVAYLSGLEFMTGVVERIEAADWENPSPCGGWRAVDVLGHVGQAVGFGTALLSGRSPAWEPVDPPGSLVEGAPGAWWQDLVGPAREALGGVDVERVVDSPAGPRSIGDGLRFPAVDLFLHAWDIGCSAGFAVTIPDGAIEFAHRVFDPIPAAQLRRPAIFGPEVEVASGASNSDAFLAWTGRDPGLAAG